jgi:glycerol-3-phosphate acyltransferase PlsY
VAEDKFGFQGGKAANRTVGYLSVFSSVVVGAFQITFRSKIHANDVFSFLKIIFDISTSKRSKTYKPY